MTRLSCTGPTRRHVLKAGLATLPQLLQASSNSTNDNAVIFVLQEGGASQFETWGPKPDAGAEIRGEFQPIRTAVPGTLFSELMVEQAIAASSVHAAFVQRPPDENGLLLLAARGIERDAGRGSGRVEAVGPVVPNVPPYAVLSAGERYDGPLYLGSAFSPFTVKNDHRGEPGRRPSTG